MENFYPMEISDQISGKFYYPDAFHPSESIQTIAFGTTSIPIKGEPHPEAQDRIIISKDVSEKLAIPHFRSPLHLFLREGTLHLGPLVGVFTTGFTPVIARPLGERSYYFSKLLTTGQANGVFPFVFGKKHIDWERGLISGFFYVNNHWEVHEVPFPHVIYDRLPNRRAENSRAFQQTKKILETKYFIPWYNPGFFNKLDVFERLQTIAHVNKYLPRTSRLNFNNAKEMLMDFGSVYIKPAGGSHGSDIHHIIFDKDKQEYFCRFLDKNKEYRLQKYKKLSTLFEHVFFEKKIHEMIVQQGISLLTCENKPVDFRVHANKDKKGKWIISAIAAKLGHSNGVTTHVHGGGEVKTMTEVFPEKPVRQKYKRKLIETAHALSVALDRQMNGIIGEIGFDLGIDINDNIWLFEANSKPGRSIFLHPKLTVADERTRKLALDFAIYLTKRSIEMPEEIMDLNMHPPTYVSSLPLKP